MPMEEVPVKVLAVALVMVLDVVMVLAVALVMAVLDLGFLGQRRHWARPPLR